MGDGTRQSPPKLQSQLAWGVSTEQEEAWSQTNWKARVDTQSFPLTLHPPRTHRDRKECQLQSLLGEMSSCFEYKTGNCYRTQHYHAWHLYLRQRKIFVPTNRKQKKTTTTTNVYMNSHSISMHNTENVHQLLNRQMWQVTYL